MAAEQGSANAAALARYPIVISHVQTGVLVRNRGNIGWRCEVSPDLGLSTIQATIRGTEVLFANGEALGWQAIEEISASVNNCFEIRDGEAHKILAFSEGTNRVYSLMPTQGAPTMLVSGIPMHRIKETDPYRDTLNKIKTVRPVVGRVLDTATGLGYTAIEAAKTADHVTTIELDPTVLEIARRNPWSRSLFDTPSITQRIGDSHEVVEDFGDETFGRIVHDPPTFSLAGHLYSSQFYVELYRVLQRGGRMFHYVGSPETRSGRNITRGVMARLRQVGFSRVARRPFAFGVVAFK